MKKLLIAAVLVLALAPLSWGPRQRKIWVSSSSPLTLVTGRAWDLTGNGSQITPALFGLNFRVANGLSAGIQTLKEGATSDNFLILKYNFLPQTRATVGFGTTSGSAAAASIGFEVIPFSRSVGGQAATEFKLIAKYDAPFNNVAEGKILFVLALGIGF